MTIAAMIRPLPGPVSHGNAREAVMTVIVYADFNCPYSCLAGAGRRAEPDGSRNGRLALPAGAVPPAAPPVIGECQAAVAAELRRRLFRAHGPAGASTDGQGRVAASRLGNEATSSVSAPMTPALPAPPGEPSGWSRPGSGSAKNRALSSVYGSRSDGRSSS